MKAVPIVTPDQSTADEHTINLHDVYRRNSDCGYVQPMHLRAHEAGDLAAHMRGISAISAVLIAGSISERMTLGDYLQGGLVEAIHALSRNAGVLLDTVNDQDRRVMPDGEIRHG